MKQDPKKEEKISPPPNLPAVKSEVKQELQTLSAAEVDAMFGDLGKEDISVPRLTVLQGLSPEVTEGLGTPGNFFAKGLNRLYGKELEIIPILRSRSRLKWVPMAEGGGVACQAFDAKVGQGDPGGNCDTCLLKEWQGSKPPACDLYENMVVVVRTDEDWIPMALSGSRTKLSAFKDLNTLFWAEREKQRPIYMKSYVAKVVADKSGSGLPFFNLR